MALETGLAGRNILVTGATGGIGAAISRTFAAEGANVALHYHAATDAARTLKDQLGAAYPEQRFVTLQADVSDRGQVAALFGAVDEQLGPLHVFVGNAGINRDMTLAKADWDEWHHVVEVNLLGVVYCCREAADRLGDGGRIVNISSIIGHLGSYGLTNYASAKAGVIGFTKSLAAEVARKGITVNAVAPGFVDTPMTAPMTDRYREMWEKRAPLRRFGRPEEVAHAVVFLASDKATYITGAVLDVNGGTL